MKSLYVHSDLLEWFENITVTDNETKATSIKGVICNADYLIENLSPENNCIVEEICHHEFDDNIKHIVSDRSGDNEELLMDCLARSKYQMFWLSATTFFIVIDKYTEEVLHDLEIELKKADVFQYLCNQYEKEVNWLTIKEILVFEFEPNLEENIFMSIDDIFWNNIERPKKSPSLYFAEILPWHEAEFNYIEIDTLALDICGEVWIRYNLLKDLNLDDLLCVELANKDFRHPYYDHYLDNYLQRCIAKKLPFNIEVDRKIEFPLPYFDNKETTGYFMYKYRKYISTLYTSDPINKRDFDYVTKILEIPNFQFLDDRLINLNKNDLDTEEILQLCKPVHRAVYEISANFNFSNNLFVQLLNLPNIWQIYSFNFSEQITFEVPLFVDKISWLGAVVEITIHVSGAQNSQKLGNLIEYFLQIFQDVAENVRYIFDSCILSDFAIFKNIGISSITFDCIALSHEELLKLAAYLNTESLLVIKDCTEIHDLNILEFIKQSKITPSGLSIKGKTSCTFLANFMIAEHLINKQGSTDLSIHMGDLPFIEEFETIFQRERLEFFISDNAMVLMRYIQTKENVDAYNLLNGIVDEDEPPFDYD